MERLGEQPIAYDARFIHFEIVKIDRCAHESGVISYGDFVPPSLSTKGSLYKKLSCEQFELYEGG